MQRRQSHSNGPKRKPLSVDPDFIYINDWNVICSVTAADNLTPSTDAHWMLLYLDTDNDASTWWEGFDFFIADGKLCRYEDPPRPLGTPPVMEGRSWRVDGSWPVVCPVKIVCEWQQPHGHRSPQGAGSHGQSLHPRLQVGRQPLRPFDIISISTTGDTAPNRRFRYRFQWSK